MTIFNFWGSWKINIMTILEKNLKKIFGVPDIFQKKNRY